MGTLTDITTQANNAINRLSNSSPGYHNLSSSGEKENLAKPKSPHFMTPTFSSSKQSVAVKGKSPDRDLTPVPAKSSKADGGNVWMKSAAKRVGIRGRGDGTPRSKKGGSSKQTKAISFPDKVSALNHSSFGCAAR